MLCLAVRDGRLSLRVALAQPRATALSIAPHGFSQLREWDARIERMLRAGELRIRQTQDDPLVEGRTHERADQYQRRGWGVDVARQLENGLLISAFGTIYPEVMAATTATIDEDTVRSIVEQRAGVFCAARQPELVILPIDDRFVLTWEAARRLGPGYSAVRRCAHWLDRARIQRPEEASAGGIGRDRTWRPR